MNMLTDLVYQKYGLKIQLVKDLASYEDKNILVSTWFNDDTKRKYLVLKIINPQDSKHLEMFQSTCLALLQLNEKGFCVSKPIKGLAGPLVHLCDNGKGLQVFMLFEFIPGISFDKIDLKNENKFLKIILHAGEMLAKLNKELSNFSSESLKRSDNVWKLENVTRKMTGPRLRYVQNESLRELCSNVINAFEDHVLSRLNSLRNGIIHNDLNSANIILEDDEEYKISGIIDFGELVESKLVFDIATLIAFMMCKADHLDFDIKKAALVALKGYEKVIPLLERERNCLNLAICARLVSYICSASVALQVNDIDSVKRKNILREFEPATTTLPLIWENGIDLN